MKVEVYIFLQVEELGLGHSATNAGTWKVNYEFGEYDPNSQTVTGSKNTGNIARQTVSFDGLPNAFVQTYQYDSLYRLTDANEMAGSSENWSEKFTYDRYGNRDKKFRNGLEITNNALSHPSIDPNTNHFTTTGYGYDKVGNLVTDAEGRNFTFDGNNKQRIVYDGNQTVGEYFYDGDGMRVKKKVYSNGTHTKTVVFVYSSGKLVEEYSTEAPPTDKKIKYLTKDHLGTPRIITDGNGAVVSRRDFMPFGEEIANNVGTRSTSSFKYSANEDDVRQKFTGYQQDSETQLDFAEARMYENRHARFTAVDPLLASGNSGNPQTFNRFVYVLNSPLFFTDPTGECPTTDDNGNTIPCPDTHEGPIYTKIVNGVRRFNNVKPDKSWEVFQGTATTTNEMTGTVIEVSGGYIGSTYFGSWSPVLPESEGVVEINQAIPANETNADAMLRGFKPMGEASLPVLEAITPMPIPGGGAAAPILINSIRAIRVAKTTATAVKTTKAATAVGRSLPIIQRLCFVAGTPILTDEGLKSIEDIKENDRVLSYNENTKQTEYKIVSQTIVRYAEDGRILKLKIENEAEELGVTGEHPFYVRIHRARDNIASDDDDEGEWREAKDLQIGDEIRRANGTWSKVENVSQQSEGATVYNFTVEDNHNYFVGRTNLLAHNNDGCKFVTETLKSLGIKTTKGSGRGVVEVTGGIDAAKMVFNSLRGKNKIKMVSPGGWISKSTSGVGTVTLRFRSKSGLLTLDVHGIEKGLRKIKFK